MMNKDSASVDIVVPMYNSKQYINATIDSVVQQTYENWRMIIVDDNSTDDSCNLVEKRVVKDDRIILIKQLKNNGAGVSRNIGINNSNSEYVAFLDSDDIWEKDKLEVQVEAMIKENINFSFTSYRIMKGKDLLYQKIVDFKHDSNSFCYLDMLKKKATIGCSTVMLRRAAYKDMSMPEIRTGQDYAFWLDLLKNGSNAYLVKIPLSIYRISPGSLSRNKVAKARRQWKIYRELQSINLIKSLYYFTFYVKNVFFRK